MCCQPDIQHLHHTVYPSVVLLRFQVSKRNCSGNVWRIFAYKRRMNVAKTKVTYDSHEPSNTKPKYILETQTVIGRFY